MSNTVKVVLVLVLAGAGVFVWIQRGDDGETASYGEVVTAQVELVGCATCAMAVSGDSEPGQWSAEQTAQFKIDLQNAAAAIQATHPPDAAANQSNTLLVQAFTKQQEAIALYESEIAPLPRDPRNSEPGPMAVNAVHNVAANAYGQATESLNIAGHISTGIARPQG